MGERLPKAERLLHLVRCVQARPHQTARELARECGVSEWTFYRDLVDLALMGLHIEVDRVRGGYVLASRSFLPPLNLTAEEFLAVRTALQNPLLQGTPWHRAAVSACDKIMSAMRRTAGRVGAEEVGVRLHPRPPSVGERMREVLATLQQAIAERRRLRLHYDAASDPPGTPRVRVVDPYQLLFASRSWYLIAFCHHFREPRMFKLQRIEDVAPTGELFDPPDFDLNRWLEGAWNLFVGEPPVTVRARFAPRVAHLLRETRYHPTQEVRDEPDGSVLFSATVSGWREIGWWLLSFGDQVEVLEPPELQAELARVGRWLVERYGGRSLAPDTTCQVGGLGSDREGA